MCCHSSRTAASYLKQSTRLLASESASATASGADGRDSGDASSDWRLFPEAVACGQMLVYCLCTRLLRLMEADSGQPKPSSLAAAPSGEHGKSDKHATGRGPDSAEDEDPLDEPLASCLPIVRPALAADGGPTRSPAVVARALIDTI